jgi:chromosome partitioning protein
MKTVAVLNQKGGSGKTTIATNLAVAFRQRGRRVVIIDADPQQTASEWAARGEDTPATYQSQTTDIHENLPALREAFDVAIIDGAPRMTELATSAVKAADLVLIPVQPSGADIWAAKDILDIIQERQRISGGPQAAFVVTRAVPRTNLAGSVRGALDTYGVRVLDSRTGQRVAYPEALGAGVSVLETGGKAAKEIESMADEVTQILNHSNE